jgi:hypothetical protein
MVYLSMLSVAQKINLKEYGCEVGFIWLRIETSDGLY